MPYDDASLVEVKQFTIFVSLDDVPKLKQLEQLTGPHSKTIRVIGTVAAKWEELAMALGFDASAIDCIRRDYTSDCKEACSQMLAKWLETKYNDDCRSVSWGVLIDCLEDAEFSSIARELEIIMDTS